MRPVLCLKVASSGAPGCQGGVGLKAPETSGIQRKWISVTEDTRGLVFSRDMSPLVFRIYFYLRDVNILIDYILFFLNS